MTRLSLWLLGATSVWCAPLVAQLSPPSNGGIAEFDRVLHQLTENRRLLVIGAHPDDEDTQLLALASREYGARAAYLSLSRGEGGQNLIGVELGPALGLLRSQELQAARGIDRAQQYFSRAFDFGFTRSLDETSRFWHPDSILKDAVRVVRRFRPHVIVSIFSGTPRDGHGQHQAAGVTALAAFGVAGDSNHFAELLTEEGLQPWRPSRLYRSAWIDPNSATLHLSTGHVEARSGRSIHQLAMDSRSRHRSQDMGRLQRVGPASTSLILVESVQSAGGTGLFPDFDRQRSWLAELADSLRREITAVNLSAAVVPLLDALARLGEDSVGNKELVEQALGIATGLFVDALADDAELIPGQNFEIAVEVYNSGSFEITVDQINFAAPDGWTFEATQSEQGRILPGESRTVAYRAVVPGDARFTQPYFLESPRSGFLYDWRGTPAEHRSLPFQPPTVTVHVQAGVLGAGTSSERQFSLSREVSYRYNDQARGEVRREVRVVPRIDVTLNPKMLVWPSASRDAREVAVTLTHNGPDRTAGTVDLIIDGWEPPSVQRFAFSRSGESQVFSFAVVRPDRVSSAVVALHAIARTDGGEEFDSGIESVEYPHIRPTSYVLPAEAKIIVAPISFPNARRIGYIRGAADRVPEALERLGVPVQMLGKVDLESGDLSAFDVIVVGSRAYETDSSLNLHNDRLLDFVRSGGLVIVQYQQYAFIRGNFAPFPMEIARPHDRVTDETAPVVVLQPNHPVFNSPNEINDADWNGWPQERGLYFAHEWDDAYQSLLRMSDPGQPPLEGGLLVARYGEGIYVYTGLSFFRALPAGVPGASRLLLNLLGLELEALP